MGVIDGKRDIFTQIGALTSIRSDIELGEQTNSLSSINNSNEIVPFLLDMLTTIVGSEALQTTVGEIMSSYIGGVEEDLRDSLKQQFIGFNSDQTLPSGFVNDGYDMSVSNIDLFEKTKVDPNSQVGSLLYNDEVNDFDNKLYESYLTPGSPSTFGPLTITYNDNTDYINIKPINGSQTIGEFTEDYINELNIINEKQFVSEIINLIFGTLVSEVDKTLNTTIQQESVVVAIQKVINGDEIVTLTEKEISEIQESAQKKIEGLEFYDVGCGLLPNRVTVDNLEALVSGTTGNTDPLSVGNAYLDTLIGGFEDTGSEEVEDKAQEDGATIKDSFFKKLINAILNILVESVTSPPQIRALLGMFTGFKNNDIPQLGDPIDDIQNNINQVTCLANTAKSTLNEFLFNLVKKELMKLIIPVSKLILKEKINQYLAIIKSLTRLL